MKVAILGGGPAGMSCANALLSFGLTPVVIERAPQVGGIQLANFHPNLWMLGMPGETGIKITERLTRHYFELPITTFLDTELMSARPDPAGFRLVLSGAGNRQELAVAAVVLATGSHPRVTPELAALADHSPRVIVGPLSDTIRDGIRGDRVLILGGGDNALDHALYLAERGNRVTVRARGEFSARQQFQGACAGRPEITLHRQAKPRHLALSPDGIFADGEAFDWLLVMYGYEPNTRVLERFEPGLRPQLGKSGHILVERGQRTSIPGIYAAGDVTDCIQPSVPTAIAQGLAAAKAVELDLASPGRT